jgi:hypothetical protein
MKNEESQSMRSNLPNRRQCNDIRHSEIRHYRKHIWRRDVIDALLEETKTAKNNSEKIIIEKKLTELSN